MDALLAMKRLGIWLEVTTLIVPGVNDDPAELQDIARFVASELGTAMPWHIGRFFPAHKMADVPPTPNKTLERARDIGLGEELNYVYIRNLLDGSAENTICLECRSVVITRRALRVVANLVRDGGCPKCGTAIAGVGMKGG